MEREWIVDADMSRDGLLAFCPIERNENGEVVSVVTGLTFLGSEPPSGEKCIGVWSESGGEEAAGDFARANRELLIPLGLFADRDSVHGAA